MIIKLLQLVQHITRFSCSILVSSVRHLKLVLSVKDKFCLTLYFQVKNKAPAPVQITAEQLLREAKERQLELVPPVS